MNTPPFDQTRWFAEEIQPHEAALRADLAARFPNLSDKDDVLQETYLRVLQAQAAGGVRSVKAYLFTTARNAALDFFRRRNAKPAEEITDLRESRVLQEQPDAAETFNQQQELAILSEAVGLLPDRCRQVVMLRYLDGLAYKEIAVRLGISPETVKVHLAKGVRRCAEYFEERGLLKSKLRDRDLTK